MSVAMIVNPDSIPRYEQPMDEPERTPFEWMDMCKHCDACQRIYELFIDSCDHVGWRDDMARILGCKDCEEFE